MSNKNNEDLWFPIDGFSDYFINTSGDVTHNGKYIKPHVYNKYGHRQVRLYKDHKQYTKDLHRLVAETFIPNPNNYPIVRHLDDDPSNNNINNLAWGTRKDNTADSIRNGGFHYNYHYFTRDEIRKSNETNRTPVKAINIKTGEQREFISQQEAARQLNVSQGNIGMVLSGRRNHTGGYRFEYADKEVISYD